MKIAQVAPLAALDFELLFAALPTPRAVLSADGGTVLALNAALRRVVPAAPAAPGPAAALQAAVGAAGFGLVAAAVPESGPPVYYLCHLAAVAPAAAGTASADVGQHLRQQLASAQAEHASILEQAPVGINVMMGPEHRYTFVNAALDAVVRGRIVVGRTVVECLPELVGQGFVACLDEVYRSGEAFVGHEVLAHLDDDPADPHGPGRDLYFDFTYQPLRDGAGRTTGILAFVGDATARVLARRHAEAAQAEAQAAAVRLQRVTESQPSTSFVVDADGAITYVSPQWYAYTGMVPGTDINAAWPELLHPDDLPAVGAAFGEALAQGTAWSYEFRLRGADGRYRWFASQGHPEPLAEAEAAGRPRQWFGSNLDIDERRRAQAQVLAQEQRLAAILDHLPLTVATVEGPALCFTYLSAEARAVFGPRAQVGRPAAECMPEVAAQGYAALLAQVRDTGQPVRGHEERLDILDPATGALREVFSTYGYLPLPGADGTSTGVLAYSLDATEQVLSRRATEAAQAAAAVADQRLRLLAENLPLIVFENAPDGRTTYLSPQWLAYTGQDATTFDPTRDWPAAIHPDDLPALAATFAASLGLGDGPAAEPGVVGAAFEAEYRLRRYDGQYRWYLTRTAPQLEAATGAVLRWHGTAIDIDDLKQAQAGLQAQEQRLQAMLAQAPASLGVFEGEDLRLGFFNPLFQRLSQGRSVPGQPLAAVFPEAEARGFAALMHEVRRTGRPNQFEEVPLALTDPCTGHVEDLYLDVAYLPLAEPGRPPHAVLNFVIDATERVLARHQAEAAQAAAARQAQDLQTLTDAVPSFIYALLPDGTVSYLSAGFNAYTGLDAALPSANAWASVHPDDLPAATAAYAAAVAQGTAWDAQLRLYHAATGTHRWFQTRATPQRDAAGQVLYYGITTDIHALRLAQDEVVEREAQLRTLTETIPQLVWTTEADGRTSYVNQRYVDYTGLDVAALATQGWNGIVHPDDLPATLAEFAQKLVAGAEMSIEARLCHHAGGAYRWFLHRAVPQHDAQGTFVRWHGTSTDVQQQHEMQEQLALSEAELRLQAESLPQQIWTAAPDGELDFYNHRTTAYLGLNPATAAGTSWLECLHPDDRAPAAARWAVAVAGGRYYEAEFRLRRYDGTYRWFLAQAQARRDAATGQLLRWYGTNTDIEDQKRAQRQLVQQNTRLQRTNRDLDNFVYTASHDLKQPITNMAGIFEELRRTATFADPEAPRLLDMFDRSLAQIYGTIDELVEIVRVQRPVAEQEVEAVDLAELAGQVAASLQSQAAPLGATFAFDFAACPRIRAVRSYLQSTFYNFLSNALKYADPARPPRIRASCAPDPATGQPVLTFADNGLGLDLEQVGGKLFEQFTRYHPHIEGSGMGLYLVNRIVEQTGGHLEVASEVGVGTTFTVYWGG